MWGCMVSNVSLFSKDAVRISAANPIILENLSSVPTTPEAILKQATTGSTFRLVIHYDEGLK
jgi:hypothetical protein